MFESIDRTAETGLRDRVDRDELIAHVDAFADLRRYPASEDQWEAAEYVVDTLDRYGVETTLHTVEAYTSVPESAAVEVVAPTRRTVEDAIPVAFGQNTPPGGVTGDLVAIDNVADATTTPQLSGSVALLDGLPTPAAVRKLRAADAAAAVFASPTPGYLHEMIASPGWGSPDADDADRLPDLPVVEVHHEEGTRLRAAAAGDDLRVTVHATAATELRELPCPVGRVEGTDTDRYLIVGNHVDSWHEGVTDNATAMAATLELARLFADDPPKRGLLFGFWPGHSMGRYAGSTWYADEHWLDLRENGVGYYHLDLNGLDGADSLSTQHMAEVEAEHVDAVETAPPDLPMQTGESHGDDLLGDSDRPGRNSDQSFWGAGLTAMLSGARFSPGHEDAGPVGGGWWWHTTADTRDKVDLDLLVDEVRLFATVCSRFCHSPVLPTDYRATVSDLRAAVEAVDREGVNVDFDPVYDRLDTLDERLTRFTDHVDAISSNADVDSAVEDLQVDLGNRLIPALYMRRPDYEHDPALPHDLAPSLDPAADLPDLSGPRRRFAETSVTRARTRLAHRVEGAVDAVDRFLDDRD